jgi:hypothetical protein
MGKFIITEDEKKYIRGLYEQITNGAMYNTTNDPNYDYKKEGDKYFFKVKSNPTDPKVKAYLSQKKYIDWTEATNKSAKDAIAKVKGGFTVDEKTYNSGQNNNNNNELETSVETEKKDVILTGEECPKEVSKFQEWMNQYHLGWWKSEELGGEGKGYNINPENTENYNVCDDETKKAWTKFKNDFLNIVKKSNITPDQDNEERPV